MNLKRPRRTRGRASLSQSAPMSYSTPNLVSQHPNNPFSNNRCHRPNYSPNKLLCLMHLLASFLLFRLWLLSTNSLTRQLKVNNNSSPCPLEHTNLLYLVHLCLRCLKCNNHKAIPSTCPCSTLQLKILNLPMPRLNPTRMASKEDLIRSTKKNLVAPQKPRITIVIHNRKIRDR
jgi:hypothetical protein